MKTKVALSMQRQVDQILPDRLSHLLAKRDGPALRAWKRRVPQTVSVPAEFRFRPQGFLLHLMAISVACNTIIDIHPDYNYYATDAKNSRLRQKAERNERLLHRLLYLGAVRRGNLCPAVTVTLRHRKSRLRQVTVPQSSVRCIPMPSHILRNGKSNMCMVLNGEMVHVCEADQNGRIVHRPDLMPTSWA